MIKITLTTLAALAAGVTFAACGGVPGNAVATVDGEAIDKRQFSHWMTVMARANDPKGKAPKPGSKEYTAARDQVVQLLISFKWIQGEADAMDLAVSDAEIRKSFDEQKKQAFPKEADYQKYIETSGQTEQDILQRVELDLLSNKIREKVVKDKDAVSEQAIATFYDRNKARFAQPEKRDLRVVLTKGRADAEKARAALERGGSWKSVAKKYSIDDTSKASGGKLPAQAKGTLDKELDDAVFGAEKGELVGPVKTQFGHYVFTVSSITAPTQQSLAEAKETIKQTLTAENQQKALDTFLKDFTRRWREKTECSEGYRTSDCANGPKPTPAPTVA